MMSFITPALVNSAVQAITPVLLATLAGVLCAQAGVFNIAMEGQLLIGAFAGVAGSYFLGSAWGGVTVAVVSTVVFSLILAYGATVFRGDPVVICIGMNLLASGLHRLSAARDVRRVRDFQRRRDRRPREDPHRFCQRNALDRLDPLAPDGDHLDGVAARRRFDDRDVPHAASAFGCAASARTRAPPKPWASTSTATGSSPS